MLPLDSSHHEAITGSQVQGHDQSYFAMDGGSESGGGAFVIDHAGGTGSGKFSPRRPIPPKLYRIGEVVEYSGMSRQTIHNYTTMGLLHESRWTNGGHRLYDESVFERLDMIAQMKSMNKTIEDIRDYFERKDRS